MRLGCCRSTKSARRQSYARPRCPCRAGRRLERRLCANRGSDSTTCAAGHPCCRRSRCETLSLTPANTPCSRSPTCSASLAPPSTATSTTRRRANAQARNGQRPCRPPRRWAETSPDQRGWRLVTAFLPAPRVELQVSVSPTRRIASPPPTVEHGPIWGTLRHRDRFPQHDHRGPDLKGRR